MKALGDNVLIEKINEKHKVQGFDMSEEDEKNIRYKKAKVVLSGDEVEDKIKKDDVILYDSRAGYNLMINDKMYTVIRSRDVAFIL